MPQTPRQEHNPKHSATPDATRPGDEQDPDLECGICMDLLNDAYKTPCCGQLACCACLDMATGMNPFCPFCRRSFQPGAGLPDTHMERRAANTVRPCPHSGCDFRGKRDDLHAHIATCGKRPPTLIISELRVKVGALQQQLAKSCQLVAALCRQQNRIERHILANAFASASPTIASVEDLGLFRGGWSTRMPWSDASFERSCKLEWECCALNHATLVLRAHSGGEVTIATTRTAAHGHLSTLYIAFELPDLSQGRPAVYAVRIEADEGATATLTLPVDHAAFKQRFVHNGVFVITVTGRPPE